MKGRARGLAHASSAVQRARVLCTAAAPVPLQIALILGSTRTEGPPRPANVGSRVGMFAAAQLSARGHTVDVVDPIAEDLPLLIKPHFAYRQGAAPGSMDNLASRLREANAFVMLTPEYNHAPSPALLNLLNHFGGSIFAFKPSAIVSYSQGQWGGTRAAVALRPVLSELGCLPVSAMVHVPRAHEVFDERGAVLGDDAEAVRWESYSARAWSQLEWWGGAAKRHRDVVDPTSGSPPLRTSPNQRNAPSS